MKILIIRNYPNYMDVKYNTYNIQEVGLAKAMVRRGHICDIVFWGEKEDTVYLNFGDNKQITIYYRTGKNILKNAIFHHLDDLIIRYDVIQPCEYNQIQAWLLANKYPKKTIIYHGPYYSSFNKGYNKLCKVFDAIFLHRYKTLNTPFITKSKLAGEFLQDKGINNIHTIGVGIDIDALATQDEEIPEFIRSISHEPNVLNLLYIGRYEPRRNIPFIYEVAAELKKRGQKCQLIMVGNGDAEYMDQCDYVANELGIVDSIFWIDKLEQKYMSLLYAKCDYFLLPTHYEIFGMVLLEAMYFGLVCLTTENGGADMLIQSGSNGYVLPLDANQWCNVIMATRCGIENTSESARLYIRQNFTWDVLAKDFEKEYGRHIV